MSVPLMVIAVSALPLLVWTAAAVVVATRRLLRRRGGEDARRERLRRLLGDRDLVVLPTGDVDLSEQAVREVAADAGFRLLGYEYGNGPFRRRCGVFLRRSSETAAVIADVNGRRNRSDVGPNRNGVI